MRNKNVVNYGVVDNVKPKQPMLNISGVTPPTNPESNSNQRANNPGTRNQGNINQGNNYNANPKPAPYRRKFAPLGKNLESAFRELLANKLITLPNMRDFEPQVKPPWWNDAHYCEYHINKGHCTNDRLRLKNLFQDLIDNGNIMVDGHKTNDDHEAFKSPLPN